MNADQILPALGSIFVYAFTPHAAIGGFAGSNHCVGLKMGSRSRSILQRGGLWYCAYGSCYGVGRSSYQTGVLGRIRSNGRYSDRMYCYGPSDADYRMWTTADYDTGAIAQAAFHNAFGTFGDYFVAISVFLFVFSTLIACCMFGWKQAEYLFGPKFTKVWRYCILCS